MHLLDDAMNEGYGDWREREELFIGRHSPGPFLISYTCFVFQVLTRELISETTKMSLSAAVLGLHKSHPRKWVDHFRYFLLET